MCVCAHVSVCISYTYMVTLKHFYKAIHSFIRAFRYYRYLTPFPLPHGRHFAALGRTWTPDRRVEDGMPGINCQLDMSPSKQHW